MLVTSIFSFSHHVFYPSQTTFNFSGTIILLSANAFNLNLSKLVSFGELLITVIGVKLEIKNIDKFLALNNFQQINPLSNNKILD